jgi:hypothetical protein
MAAKNQFIKRYKNFFGFDLKSSDLNYPEKYATDISNLDLNAVGSLIKRKGTTPHAEGAGPLGSFIYNRIDENGDEAPELVSIGSTVKKWAETRIAISYSGAEASASVSVYYDTVTSQYRCILTAGATTALNQGLGLGVDETTPYTCQQLRNSIDALADWSATITGTGTVPAAYIKNAIDQDVLAGYTLNAGYWTNAISPVASPFANGMAAVNDEDFEPASAVQIQNVLYVATGKDEIQKYDGFSVYRAGVPTPASLTSADALDAGGFVGRNYVHRARYIQVDASDNFTEGNLARVSTPISTQHRAIIKGAQTTVTTINVEPGSDILNGDTVEFYDSVSASLVTRTVTGVSTTPLAITISGAAVTVADADEILSTNARRIDVTVANVQAGTGFNTGCAIVNGNQGFGPSSYVNTINVDNGSGGPHTLQVGDTAYFYDGNLNTYVQRKVTNVTTNTITIAGAGVEVLDNAVISANLRIGIYRNETSATEPTTWYEVVQIPNNSFAPTQVYQDKTSDANLGVDLLVPLVDRSPPPKARYLTVFQNLLVAGCLTAAPNVVAWSDIEGAEYFPTPDNQQLIQSLEADRITAVAPSNEVLIVFQREAIHAGSGDFADGNIRFDQITNDVGCIAHQSVRDIRGVIFFLSKIGPRKMSGAQIPSSLGTFEEVPLVSRIDPLFNQSANVDDEDLFRLGKSWAFHDRKEQKYLLFVPKESEQVGVRYCNSGSVLLVYDYARDAWLKWEGLNAAAGIVRYNDDLIFTERRIDEVGALRTISWRRQDTGTAYDYNDHTQPITIVYKSPWDFMGNASVLKNYLTLRVFTTDIVPNNFTLDCQTELNFIPTSPISEFTLNVGADGYGVTPYGSFYGDPQDSSVKHKISNGRAKSLRLIFSNDEPQTDIVITGYELEVVAPYMPAIKV